MLTRLSFIFFCPPVALFSWSFISPLMSTLIGNRQNCVLSHILWSLPTGSDQFPVLVWELEVNVLQGLHNLWPLWNLFHLMCQSMTRMVHDCFEHANRFGPSAFFSLHCSRVYFSLTSTLAPDSQLKSRGAIPSNLILWEKSNYIILMNRPFKKKIIIFSLK